MSFMSNLFSLIYFIGFLPFLFFFWRRLKEDYTSTQIFTSGFNILGFVVVFSLAFGVGLSKVLQPTAIFSPSGLWFWGAVVGFILGLSLSIWRMNMKFFETLEAANLGFLFWVSLIFLIDSVKNSSLVSLASFAFVVVIIFLFYLLDKKYKKFTWYRSGKIGFSGLSAMGLFFFTRAVVALFFPFVLSFIGKLDALISGCVSFILFLLLYNLAEYDK